MRKKFDSISSKESHLVEKALLGSARSFSGAGAAERFLQEVLTDGERVVIGRRIAIAQLILRGYTYYEINELLQVSPNTFTRIRKWVHEKIPEYKQTKKKVALSEKPTEYHKSYSFSGLKKKYPMHFLLFNLADTLLKK